MILEQLMEKKDLYIYIDLRIEQLTKEKQKIMKNTPDKKKEAMWLKFNGRISELINLKQLIKKNELKSKSKYLWQKYGKQSGFVPFPETKKMDSLDALESTIPTLAKGGIINNFEFQKKIDKMELKELEEKKKTMKEICDLQSEMETIKELKIDHVNINGGVGISYKLKDTSKINKAIPQDCDNCGWRSKGKDDPFCKCPKICNNHSEWK